MNASIASKATSAIITGAGPDKPGIVSAITGVLSQFGCNIEDTTMTRLGGDHQAWFALIIRVSGSSAWKDVEEALLKASRPLGMTPQLTPLPDVIADHCQLDSSQAPETFLITVAGADCTGLTHHVAHVLGEAEINITDLSAQVIAGESGPVYLMMIEVAKPSHQSVSDISALLAPIQKTLGVEISVRPVDVATF
ncbi:MAG: ACT domain-containing protein [Vampirovibrionales bacterium]|nr:ACT domain-containing protein [Vampirovibrionales bacterium]